ncbi:glycerophosphodiester phosphodiesterase family protein [Sporosarcina sp. E16_8]|uniref:glycerophosphodiester phosphodiesterase n=1 Tax=Sporosarcina sp. E16_8 TaxID=2789295 RepID=UPI001A90F36F|nr:glycerophosphodiester phosphodiesterase family protein [Sporosarcina sp. E16_8]MBO0587944.1 glycerophosphodiester phosphodiesterase [Sporosarcina sp. E16_8]
MGELGKKKLLFVFVSICMLLLVGYEARPFNHVEMNGMISVAHRGASNFAPENTQSAFRKALELGADFLECDVHLSKDGELIIMHDDKVDRTTNGSGYVKNFTLAELKELDAGVKFHSSFTGEKIITLKELLDEFYGKAGLLIEIKKPSMYPGIEEQVVALLSEYKDLNSIIVQSFDIESMRKMNTLLPELEVALLMKPSIQSLSTQKIMDLTSFATYINFNVSYVNKRVIDQIHNQGGKVLVWSTKNPGWVDRAYQYGVDGIITDFSIWPVEGPVQLVQE